MAQNLHKKLNRACDFIIREKYYIALIFCLISYSTFGFLNFIGILPTELKAEDNQNALATLNLAPTTTPSSTNSSVPKNTNVSKSITVHSELPIRIRIDRVGINTPVTNPTNIQIGVLDEALTHGAIRYPEGGKPGIGNMFILAHSTSYKVVNNQAYKAFNGLKNVEKGDRVIVETSDREYIYVVTSLALTTSDKALVHFDTGKNMLTLSTCNVLGAKEERYVVTGDYVGSNPKGS